MTSKGTTTKQSGRRQTRARGRRLFAAYKRVSVVGTREDDERLRSPEFQDRLIDSCAALNGVDVRDYDAELDVSGAKKERAVLDSIIEAIERGELDGIIVAKLDRLSRLAPKERIEVVDRIESAGGVILSASESFDASTPEGEFVRELFFSIARMEWRRYQGNWETAKANAIANGVAIAKTPAFGYRFNRDHRYVVDRAEAAIVLELFEERAAGASWTTLLELFEARTGRPTNRQTMSRLVRSRVYLGEVSYGELVKADAHEAIVELDLFETVQRVNRERGGENGRRHAGAAVTMLGGDPLACGGCGRTMSSHEKKSAGRRRRYECPSPPSQCSARASILADELDAYVWEELLAWAGEAADELVEVEVELGARGDRIVAEHRLAEAERSALEYEVDVELELEIGREAFAAGRRARLDLVELRREELEATGEATALELVRTTLRKASPTLEVDEKRRLVRVVLAGSPVIVRKAPRGVDVAERVDLPFKVAGASAETLGQEEPELVDEGVEAAARV